jgi:hypothetical protein
MVGLTPPQDVTVNPRCQPKRDERPASKEYAFPTLTQTEGVYAMKITG